MWEKLWRDVPSVLLLLLDVLVVTLYELALGMVTNGSRDLAGGGVVVSNPVTGDLVTLWGCECETKFVGTLEFHLEA